MGVHETRTFKSGDSVALRLPSGLAIGPDEPMLIEQKGDVLTVRRIRDAAADRARVLSLVERLRALGPAGDSDEREPLPERQGLV